MTGSLARGVVVAVAMAGTPPGMAATFNRPADVAAITAIEQRMAVETDIDKAMGYFAPDAVLADIMAPGWYEGVAAIRVEAAPQFAGVKAIAAHFDEINVATDGTLACAASVVRYEVTKGDGSKSTLAVRQLDAFRKIGGAWRMTQQQVSVPADLATGAARFDGPLQTKGPVTWPAVRFTGSPQDPAAAKADIRKWLEANIVPTTVDGAMATYPPDDAIIVFDVSSPVEKRGREALRQYFGSALTGIDRLEYRIPHFFADSDGVLATQIASLDLKIDMKDGTAQYMSFRQSDCLRRIDGRWYPFFEHGSFPIDPATGKAIMAKPEAFR